MVVFSMRYVTISMRMFAEILTVAQALEKTERLFNSRDKEADKAIWIAIRAIDTCTENGFIVED